MVNFGSPWVGSTSTTTNFPCLKFKVITAWKEGRLKNNLIWKLDQKRI